MAMASTSQRSLDPANAVVFGRSAPTLDGSLWNDVGMAGDKRNEQVGQARAALIMAAMRRSIVTYGELGRAIGMQGVDLRNQMRHVLDEVSERCVAAGEPSLAALVVNATTGEPGAGWRDGAVPWHSELQQAFKHWTKDQTSAS
jgi:hypothetical protein